MLKRPLWRNTVSAAVSLHQDQALNTTIFLLKSFGPTGFLLREDGEARNFKVCLGDPHTCTCPEFTKKQEPCKHICWILLRKFRLPREHEYSFQHGLVERHILEVLHGLHQTKAHRTENDPPAATQTPGRRLTGPEAGSVCRKMIQAQDVCPICQEELLEKKQPVSYCRFGCGNNIHISCMRVWADHQRLSDGEETVKCPLCREDFSSLKLLQEQVRNAARLSTAAEREKSDRHLGVLCHGCRVCPVTGKCFKCTVCSYLYLCEDCSHKGCHSQHPLAMRTKRRDKWHLVSDEQRGATSRPVNDSITPVAADPLPEDVLGRLSAVRVRTGSRLLEEGQQCRICLQDFSLGQRVRALPCYHKFHAHCVDGILRKSNSCPLDGYVIYNPLTWRTGERKTSSVLASCLLNACAQQPENSLKDLFIPGVALQARNSKAPPSHGSLSLEVLTGSSVTLKTPQKLITDRFQGSCIATKDAVTKEGKRGLQRKQSAIQRSPASPNRCAAVAKNREKPQLDLFVGLRTPEMDHTATVASPARRTRPQPTRTGTAATKDTSKRLIPELTMTGVVMSTQCRRKTETYS